MVFFHPFHYDVGECNSELSSVGVEARQHLLAVVRKCLDGVDNLSHARPLTFHVSQLCKDVGYHRVASHRRNVCQIHLLNDTSLWHCTWGVYHHAVVIHIHMNLTALYEVVSMRQGIGHDFQNTSFQIFGNFYALHWFLIPHFTHISANECHRVFKQKHQAAANLCAVKCIHCA